MRTWKRPDCGHTEEINYDWLAEHGGPVCQPCDCEMELLPAVASDSSHGPAVERLVEQAEEAGIEPEDMDDMVHAVASDIAAAINNGGLDEQLEFLCREMVPPKRPRRSPPWLKSGGARPRTRRPRRRTSRRKGPTMTDELDALRRLYAERESKLLGETYAGLEFDSYLTGPSGCAVVLFVFDNTTPQQIEEARVEAYQRRDVTGFTVRLIPKEWATAEEYKPQAEKKGWIDAARWIVEHRQCRRIIPETGELVPEEKRGGMLLDLFSAAAMVQVYDALNDVNRAKLDAMDLRVAHRIVFQVLK